MDLQFFMDMVPPTATAQEKQVKVVSGRPMFYKKQQAKAAEAVLIRHLKGYVPEKPFEGPLKLKTVWIFPKGKSHKDREWRITKPDTDNLQKGLKDCMTKLGFWLDDAQVVWEEVGKVWGDEPSGIVIQIEKLEKYMEVD